MNPMGGMTGQVMDGYFWSMLFLAAMPYLLLLVIGGGLFRALRRQREREVAHALEEQVEWEGRQ
ncbi:MAG: hypothetical protein OEU54_01525 [Gemmatimonadota bacterium]|nr:hypothetical protein [Gemmatimonadota bacterium]